MKFQFYPLDIRIASLCGPRGRYGGSHGQAEIFAEVANVENSGLFLAQSRSRTYLADGTGSCQFRRFRRFLPETFFWSVRAELIATEFEKADVSGDAHERGETANCGRSRSLVALYIQ